MSNPSTAGAEAPGGPGLVWQCDVRLPGGLLRRLHCARDRTDKTACTIVRFPSQPCGPIGLFRDRPGDRFLVKDAGVIDMGWKDDPYRAFAAASGIAARYASARRGVRSRIALCEHRGCIGVDPACGQAVCRCGFALGTAFKVACDIGRKGGTAAGCKEKRGRKEHKRKATHRDHPLDLVGEFARKALSSGPAR